MSLLSTRTSFAVAVCSALIAWSADAQTTRFDGVRTQIESQVRSGAIASMSVVVAQDGKIVWQEAFGWADRERQRRADGNTMYALASISKPITATALMTLVERGRISLDRPVNDYLTGGAVT